MANPQKENGYTAIANEIIDRLCSYRISGEETLILWCVFRKTYGFQKKEDKISLTQFEKMTGLKRPNVVRAIKGLVSKKILLSIKKDTTSTKTYIFNKDFDKWNKGIKKDTSIKKDTKNSINIDNQVVSKKIHTKENITKERKKLAEIPPQEDKPFNFEEEMRVLKESTRKDHRVIALYWRYKGWTFENKKQISNAIRRDVRSANYLIAYDGKDILKSMTHCQKNYDEWTLETVLSKMDDIKNKTINKNKTK